MASQTPPTAGFNSETGPRHSVLDRAQRPWRRIAALGAAAAVAFGGMVIGTAPSRASDLPMSGELGQSDGSDQYEGDGGKIDHNDGGDQGDQESGFEESLDEGSGGELLNPVLSITHSRTSQAKRGDAWWNQVHFDTTGAVVSPGDQLIVDLPEELQFYQRAGGYTKGQEVRFTADYEGVPAMDCVSQHQTGRQVVCTFTEAVAGHADVRGKIDFETQARMISDPAPLQWSTTFTSVADGAQLEAAFEYDLPGTGGLNPAASDAPASSIMDQMPSGKAGVNNFRLTLVGDMLGKVAHDGTVTVDFAIDTRFPMPDTSAITAFEGARTQWAKVQSAANGRPVSVVADADNHTVRVTVEGIKSYDSVVVILLPMQIPDSLTFGERLPVIAQTQAVEPVRALARDYIHEPASGVIDMAKLTDVAWTRTDLAGNPQGGSRWTLTPVDGAEAHAISVHDDGMNDVDAAHGAMKTERIPNRTYVLSETQAPEGCDPWTETVTVANLDEIPQIATACGAERNTGAEAGGDDNSSAGNGENGNGIGDGNDGEGADNGFGNVDDNENGNSGDNEIVEPPAPGIGSVHWTVVDPDGKPIADTTWELTTPAGEVLAFADDEDGRDANAAAGALRLENLPWGNYTLKQVSAPEGYEIDPRVSEFTLGTEAPVSLFAIFDLASESDTPAASLDFAAGAWVNTLRVTTAPGVAAPLPDVDEGDTDGDSDGAANSGTGTNSGSGMTAGGAKVDAQGNQTVRAEAGTQKNDAVTSDAASNGASDQAGTAGSANAAQQAQDGAASRSAFRLATTALAKTGAQVALIGALAGAAIFGGIVMVRKGRRNEDV